METTVRSLRRRVNFFSLFGLFVLGISLYGMHVLLAQAFGAVWAGWIIYGTIGICIIWSLLVALASKEILTGSMKSIVPWFNGDKRRLTPIYDETKAAIESVNEASKAMDVHISDTLVADEGVVNAFMAGVGSRVVVFYRGLFQALSPAGVRGVAFHEVAHAKNNDIFLTIMVISFIQAFTFLAGLFWEMAKWTAIFTLFETDRDGKRKLKLERVAIGGVGGGYAATQLLQFLSNDVMVYMFFAVALWILANFVGGMIMSLISQNREYLADATAVQYGAGRDLMKAFKEMSALKNTGKPSSNAHLVARIGISSVPGSFLSVPSHPSMESRISNIEKMLEGKAGTTAGGFMYFLLVMFAGSFIGWLTLPLFETATYLFGLPIFFLGLLTYFSLELFTVFGSVPSDDQQDQQNQENSASPTIALIIGLIIFAGFGWILWQVALVLGPIGWYYFALRVASYLLYVTILKKNGFLRRMLGLVGISFTLYIFYLLFVF